MRRSIIKFLLLFGVYVVSVVVSFAQTATPSFNIQKLANGVHAVIRKEPPSLWFNPNNAFIIGKTGVIVIDSNISSDYTREVLAALRKITDKPVKYVINTHWHEDHIIGNHVYRDAFPDVQFIGHRSTINDLATIGAANRKGSIDNGDGFVDMLKSSIAKGTSLGGQKLTDEERLGYSSDIDLVSSYLAESANFKIIMPTVVVDDRLDLTLDGRKIEIKFLGRAHTGGDLAVFLPKEKILFSGDLIVWPVPLVGSTSHPLEYAATLEKMKALNAKTIVPGHGPVMHDTGYVDVMISLLKSIRQQVETAVAQGKTLEETRKSVNLDEFKSKMCGDSQHKRFVFQNYVFLPATAAAFGQLATKN